MKYKGIILLDVLSYPYKYPNKTLLPPYIRSDYLRSLARIFHELKNDLPDISGQLINTTGNPVRFCSLPCFREHAEVPTEGLTEG